MRVHFWGVRGSIPWATPVAMAYGCNTPSIELSRDDGSRLILDAGSGIVGLSNAIVAHPRAVPILLTHYHWDHVQGLPFFAPMFDLDKAPTIHAPEFEDIDPRWVETLFQSPFFPSPKGELLVHCELEFIQAGAHSIGGFDIRAQGLNHPGGAFAYRIRGAHGDLVYATDHELGDPVVDRALGELVGGAHDLILDAHYTPDELVTYAGWGHSSWREATAFAAEHGVRRLWLFHHKPGRTDDELTEIREAARRIYPSVEIAAEGVSFEV